jgi:hypothetical protein
MARSYLKYSTARRRLGPHVWVVRRGPRFSVKEEGAPGYLVPPVRQRLAIRIARLVAQANHSELIVQGRTGRIRFRDSHGADSRRTPG